MNYHRHIFPFIYYVNAWNWKIKPKCDILKVNKYITMSNDKSL